jgi:type II secretory pathway predicted ATPase ExeA/outer membrane protein OmpA-like peptidoglycan-associated protein
VFNEFYGLTLDPFRLSPDTRFCYRHRNFSRAKAYMQYALHQGEGFVMVTGQPGTGKTTLIEDLLADRSTANVRIARMTSTQVTADDLLRLVADAFGIDARSSSKATTLLDLEAVLTRQMASGRNSLLIVDEAQNLPYESMEELRMITNLQLGARPLMQVFLVGQDGLHARVGQPRMEQLRQRILAACRMEPLGLDDTRDYLHHRLRCAGWAGRPGLSGEAVWQLHDASGGIPRRINLLASRLLLHGYIEERLTLGAEDVRLVADELQGELLIGADGAGDLSQMAPRAADPALDLRHLAIERPPQAAATAAAPYEPPAEATPSGHHAEPESTPAETTDATPLQPPAEPSPSAQPVKPNQAPAADPSDAGAASAGTSALHVQPPQAPASDFPVPEVFTQPGPKAPQPTPARAAVDPALPPSQGEQRPASVPVAPPFRPAAPSTDKAKGASPERARAAATPAKGSGWRFGGWVAAAAGLIAVSVLAVAALRPDWMGQADERLRPMTQTIEALGAKVSMAIKGTAKFVSVAPHLPAPDVSLPESYSGTLRKDEAVPVTPMPVHTRSGDLAPPEPAGTVTGQDSLSVLAPSATPEATFPIGPPPPKLTGPQETAPGGRPGGAEGFSKNGSPPGYAASRMAVADEGLVESVTGTSQGGTPAGLPEPGVAQSDALEKGAPQPTPKTRPNAAATTPPDGAGSMVVSAPDSNVAEQSTQATLTRETGAVEQPEGAAAKGDLTTLEARLVALGFRPERADDGGIKLILARETMFRDDSSEITPQARRSVEPLVRELADHRRLHFTVVGHTDDSGPADYNVYLSLLRAKAFAAMLTAGGVPIERIASEGRGEDQPLTRQAVDGIAARQVNRRIEIFIRGASL